MKIIKRFFKDYSLRKYFILIIEEYSSFFTRGLPGLEGMFIRHLFNKMTFKKCGKYHLVYRGVYLTHTYGIEIGNYFSAYYGAVIDGRGGIKIGNNVMVGPHSMIMSFNHNHRVTDKTFSEASPVFNPIVIEDNVWIGGNCSILGGVTIGSGSVISAGVVVHKDVPRNSIVLGTGMTIKERTV